MRTNALHNPGVRAGLISATLFGVGTPIAALLLNSSSPWLLAGLLYLGSGLGLGLVRLVRRAPRPRLASTDRWPLIGAVVCGGGLAPVLLMIGLSGLPASQTSLLLNAEAVFTVLLARWAFAEAIDHRIAVGMVVIVAGCLALTASTGTGLGALWSSLAILAACLCWGLDNNLTRKVALHDASWLAAVKGMAAGSVNLALAVLVGTALPPVGVTIAAMALGFVAYGLSLVLFIVSMRHVGTARAGAYFSVAPFFGAAVGIALGEQLRPVFVLSAVLMAIGVWLHLSEHHEHEHVHEAVPEAQWHTHDPGHLTHLHGTGADRTVIEQPGLVSPRDERHRHGQPHGSYRHCHAHFPDAGHRHTHERLLLP